MTTTIELTPKSTKWIYVMNGVIISGIGLQQIYSSDSWTHWTSILGIVLIVAGPLFFIYGIILVSRPNRLTPKIRVDENGVLIKEGIHTGQRIVDWKNVKEITYRPFELNFHLTNNNTETVNLTTSRAISVDVKKTIREFADVRQIKIVGG